MPPALDLVVRLEAGYGWVPQGPATGGEPADRLLRRGTLMRFTGGDQEQCPGGPGENLHFLRGDPDDSGRAREFVIPYDLRWEFGENMTEVVLVRADEPLLRDPARLDAVAADVARLIAGASPAALEPPPFSW